MTLPLDPDGHFTVITDTGLTDFSDLRTSVLAIAAANGFTVSGNMATSTVATSNRADVNPGSERIHITFEDEFIKVSTAANGSTPAGLIMTEDLSMVAYPAGIKVITDYELGASAASMMILRVTGSDLETNILYAGIANREALQDNLKVAGSTLNSGNLTVSVVLPKDGMGDYYFPTLYNPAASNFQENVLAFATNSSNTEELTISTVTNISLIGGTADITFASCAGSYPAGSLIGVNPMPLVLVRGGQTDFPVQSLLSAQPQHVWRKNETTFGSGFTDSGTDPRHLSTYVATSPYGGANSTGQAFSSVPGKINTAANGNAIDASYNTSLVTAGFQILNNTNKCSFAHWAKRSPGDAGRHAFYALTGVGDVHFGYTRTGDSNVQITIASTNGGPIVYSTFTTLTGGAMGKYLPADDSWHFIAATIDVSDANDSRIRLYIDGALVAFSNGDTSMPGTNLLVSDAASYFNESYFTGAGQVQTAIDQMMFWEGARLTARDVRLLYAFGAPTEEDPSVAFIAELPEAAGGPGSLTGETPETGALEAISLNALGPTSPSPYKPELPPVYYGTTEAVVAGRLYGVRAVNTPTPLVAGDSFKVWKRPRSSNASRVWAYEKLGVFDTDMGAAYSSLDHVIDFSSGMGVDIGTDANDFNIVSLGGGLSNQVVPGISYEMHKANGGASTDPNGSGFFTDCNANGISFGCFMYAAGTPSGNYRVNLFRHPAMVLWYEQRYHAFWTTHNGSDDPMIAYHIEGNKVYHIGFSYAVHSTKEINVYINGNLALTYTARTPNGALTVVDAPFAFMADSVVANVWHIGMPFLHAGILGPADFKILAQAEANGTMLAVPGTNY